MKQLVLKYSDCKSSEEDQILVDVLSIVTGEKWGYKQISGCCQRDWNYIYYPVRHWTKETLNLFEIMYFNTGTEWIIHDEETEPERPEDIRGYSIYCVGWNDGLIKKEIADATDANIDEVTLYFFDGNISVPTYKEAS